MKLSEEEKAMLEGEFGTATQKAMQILAALGKIYGAEQLAPVNSVQIAGVSYDNLGEAGLQFLSQLADGGGRVRVFSTLNPAGMDIENWQKLGISPEFAANQMDVIEVFRRMGVTTTCTCTPYLVGNLPGFGEHLAWSESSAVCYANSVIGARTNREGGPSALAAALTGRTPLYGMHLSSNRMPSILIEVKTQVDHTHQFGALGKALGEMLNQDGKNFLPYIRGIQNVTQEGLKSFCASLATYAGSAMFHMEGITPEANGVEIPTISKQVTQADLDAAIESLNEPESGEVDFVSLGCPHLTIQEIAIIADRLKGKKVVKEFWITTARPIKQISDQRGLTQIIEESGAKFAADTCCVVAPIRERFKVMATDSAKACYYAYSKNKFKTVFKPFEQVIDEALGETR